MKIAPPAPVHKSNPIFTSSRSVMEKEKDLGDLCEAHQAPLVIWCSTDSGLVCRDCLLFGEHRGHHYLSVEETK